jgi:hypothetical protein
MSIHINLSSRNIIMNFRRNYLSAAVVAALAGGGFSGDAGAITLSQDNIGDVGIVPYYTMRDGWATDFYIINTSSSTVAAKVRFHEARNSREVLDFIVVLSPHDMITAYTHYNAAGKPELRFPPGNGEDSCVVPIPDGGMPGGTLPFSADAIESSPDGYPNFGAGDPIENAGLDRALEGYFTVIEMGTSNEGPVHDAADHATGPDCEFVEKAFRPLPDNYAGEPLESPNIIETYFEFERNLNALKVGYSLTNVARGTQGSGSATMLSNYATWDSAIAHTKTSIAANSVDAYMLDQELGQIGQERLEACNKLRDQAEAVSLQANCNIDPSQYSCPDGDWPPASAAPVACQGAALDEYSEDLNAYNQLRVAYNNKNDEYQQASAEVLGPPQNLIYPQATLSQPDAHAPNLNTGDFLAYWLVDGEYKDDGSHYDSKPYGNGFVFNPPFGLWWGVYPRPVDAVTALLMKSDAINEWAYNLNTGATTDIILTAPTKRWYTDWRSVYNEEPHLAGISPYLVSYINNSTAAIPPFRDQFWPDGRSCDIIKVGFWNNDELGPIDPTVPSPKAPTQLCWETNVLYTGPNSDEGSLFGSKVAKNLDVRGLLDTTELNETYNGWLDVHMANTATQYHPAIPLLNLTLPNYLNYPRAFFDEIVQVGMPYIGFTFKQRDLGNPANAYSGLTPHSYLRLWESRGPLGGTLTTSDLEYLSQPEVVDSIIDWFGTNPF